MSKVTPENVDFKPIKSYIWHSLLDKKLKDFHLMANHKSAKKRIRTNERKRVVNQRVDSKIKSSVKKALAETNKEVAEKLYKEAVSILDKGTTKGLIKKNTASRKKSGLTRHLNGLQPAKTETK